MSRASAIDGHGPRPKQPRRASAAQREAGATNLRQFMATAAQPPATTHGAASAAAQRGELPAGFERFAPVVESFYDGWISDLGGVENVSSAKRALLIVARGCLVVWLLGLAYVEQCGLTDAKGEAQPILKVLNSYGNSLRLHLCAAGLERQARDVTPTLEAYLREREEKQDTNSATQPEVAAQ